MGIALSIEPLCHFNCFDDNQCIAGVILLQLSINFPVDPLGFRRQLFSLFGAGDEQIAIGDDAVHQDCHLFQQVCIGDPDALTAIRIGAIPTLANPVLAAHPSPHRGAALRTSDQISKQVEPLEIFLEGVPLSGCFHGSRFLILLFLNDRVIFPIANVFGVSDDSCDTSFIPHIRSLTVGDLPLSQQLGNTLEGCAVDVGAEYLADDRSFILCDDCPSISHGVTVWDIAYLLHGEVPLCQSISVNLSPPMRVTVISSRRLILMA